MLLDRWLPDLGAGKVAILATDINPRFLRKAREGVYSEWSLRGTPEWVRARYFNRRNDARFELSPHIRKRVTFSYLNLADDVYPSLLNDTNAMDVILCRNVLMYFTPERAKQVVEKLHRSLADGGWLIVSPVETSSILFSSFSAVPFPGVVLYRKIAGAATRVVALDPLLQALPADTDAFVAQMAKGLPSQDTSPMMRAPLQNDASRQRAAPAAGEPHEAPRPKRDDGDIASATARNCANQGRLAEAIEWCEKALAADKLNPARHYLLAAIQQEQGLAEAALRSLERALYLDSGFVLAHFALGNVELSRGRCWNAGRHFANALALLRTRAREEILPESDGLTAGRLSEIITSVLASLPRARSAQA